MGVVEASWDILYIPFGHKEILPAVMLAYQSFLFPAIDPMHAIHVEV